MLHTPSPQTAQAAPDIEAEFVDRGVAASTIAAVKYLIRENDSARLRAFLAKHSAGERAAIEKYFQQKGARK
jgi:hypothetical protein